MKKKKFVKNEAKNNMKLTKIITIWLIALLFITNFTPNLIGSEETNSPSKEIILVKTNDIDQITNQASINIQVLETYEQQTLIEIDSSKVSEIERMDVSFQRMQNRGYIGLQSHSFKTENGLPDISNSVEASSHFDTDKEKYIIQFIGPIKAEWQEELRELGVKIHEFRHRFNLIVEMDGLTKDEVEELYYVNWVGMYQPAYRFNSALLKETDPLFLEVRVFESNDAVKMAEEIHTLGGTIHHIHGNRIMVKINSEDIPSIAHLHNINSITTAAEKYYTCNHNATWITQTNEFENRKVTDSNITGLGQIITVMDSELYGANSSNLDHEMWADPENNTVGEDHRKIIEHYVPLDAYGDLNNGGYHGTHVVGTVLGDSPPYNNYSNHDGNALEARLIFQDIDNNSDSSVYPPDDMYGNAWTPSYISDSRVHTNSWGGGTNYSGWGLDGDQFIWDYKDYNILFAMGNDQSSVSPNTLTQQAEGKNIISVGSVDKAPNQNDVSSFSSRGYADDGRIKPTIMHVGQSVISSSRSTNGYTSLSGTSMATPGIAGQIAQIRQYYEDGWYPYGFSNPTNDFNPSNALIRATLINGAVEINGSRAYQNDNRFPNGDQGYGRSKLDRVLHFDGDERNLIVNDSWNEGVELNTGESWERTFVVIDPDQEVEVTLAWTDYPGSSGANQANPAIVNDLDLEVTAPNGTRYVGNAFTGFNPGFSEPNPTSNPWNGLRSGEFDGLNVEENILLLPEYNGVQEGTYQVTVTAHQVSSGSQPFAVVVSGGVKPQQSEEPWVNSCPVSFNVNPANGSIDVDVTIGQWSVNISDADGNNTNGSIHCSNGNETIWNNKVNDTQRLNLSLLDYNTNYTIHLNYTDGHCTVNETYWFITKNCYNLTIMIQGNGTITKNPDLPCYPNGTTVELNATPEIGWEFNHWSGDISGEENSTMLSMTNDYDITSVFTRKGPFTITNTTSGNGSGTIEIHPIGPYYHGDTVTVWANASQGSNFTGFNGDLTGTESPQNLMMDGNKSINAQFILNNYQLTINSTNGGVVTNPGEGDFIYDYGSNITLEARPIIGYHFVEWTGENQTIANTNDNVTTITIQNDSNITAIFSKDGPFTLNRTTNGTGSGCIEVNKTGPYYYGDTLSVWANASIGSTFTGFFGDLQGSNSPQMITMTENKTVNAEFTLDCYQLNITIIGNGNVNCEPNQTCYPYDTEIKITPNTEFPWYFSEWTGPNATDLVNNGDGSWNITILNDTEITSTFLEQWVNTCPVSQSESPTNKSTGNDIEIGEWSVIIRDADGNNTNGSIHCSNGNETIWNNKVNDTQRLNLSLLDYNTNYTIHLNYTDGHCMVNETFWFVTRNQFDPIQPADFIAETQNRFQIDLSWIPTDDFTYIEYNTTADWLRGEGEFLQNDTSQSYQHIELNPGTTYYYQAWSYNATDNSWSTFATDFNSTISNQAPLLANPIPGNESDDQEISFIWMIDINDSEGDIFNWSIECNNSQNNAGIDELYGTKQLLLDNLAYNTTYTIWVNATDEYGAETKEWYTFTTKDEPWVNSCPVSSGVSPTNMSEDVSINVGQWSVDITDADGNKTSGNISCSNGKEVNWSDLENGTRTLDLGSLNYNTKYTIYLNYTDGQCTVNETFWFITSQQPTNPNPGGGGTGGGGSGGIPPPTNQNPIANATVDKNTGYPNEIFIFNASSSKDADGNIVNYTWDFDDGINVSTNQTMITHKFTSPGVYQVMLTVIDDNGGMGRLDQPIIIDIKQANNPPKDLIVTPEDTWTHQNMEMIFMMSATDQDDNDTIRFEIDWDDGNTTVSEPVNSSKTYEISHAWNTYGIYTVAVTAYDKSNATTETYTLTIQVDIKIIDELNAWIIDRDGDGIFDQYKDLTNSTLNNISAQETGNYLIDTNNDGIWDYEYQLANGDIHPLNTVKETDEDGSFPLWGMIILIILSILAFIGLLFFKGIIYIEYEEE